ncbi:MAG: class I adenylate-forming enzyme family protein [Burkholderiales bacterium]
MTEAASVRDLDLAALLRFDAAHYADKPALVLDGRSVSFGELARAVDAQVAVLGRHVEPGDRVALWFGNSVAWLAAFLALNALGAVSVPINTRLTSTELATILRDVRARALVTVRRYRNRPYLDEALGAAQALDEGLVVLDATDGDHPGHWPVHAPARALPMRDAVPARGTLCIQYTSGTTALPKGAQLTNAAYLQTAAYVARCQRLTPNTRFVSGAPFFHCSGTMHAITVCLLAGCTLHAMSAWDPERFLDIVERHRCDVSHMVYYRDVLPLGADRSRAKLATMQVTHDLGTRDYLARIRDELGIPGVSNIYGMTETCGQFTMWYPDDAVELRLSANGRPQPGNRVRIADPETGAIVPAGGTGEIQMHGPTITAGYFSRPDATAAAFTADGWLRSGDLGRMDGDGVLTYIARLKEIIRVGGENLAPAEVEQVLRDAARVQQVCVLGVPDPRLDEVAAAVVVGAAATDWESVLREMRTRLAGFKMPKSIYTADELPMTATNRVQRAVLREWIVGGKLQRVA